MKKIMITITLMMLLAGCNNETDLDRYYALIQKGDLENKTEWGNMRATVEWGVVVEDNDDLYSSFISTRNKAIEDLTKAIQLKPDYPTAYYHRSKIYRDLTYHVNPSSPMKKDYLPLIIADLTAAIETNKVLLHDDGKPHLDEDELLHYRARTYLALGQLDKFEADSKERCSNIIKSQIGPYGYPDVDYCFEYEVGRSLESQRMEERVRKGLPPIPQN